MITSATYNDYSAIMELWELSVKATHNFLPEDYFQEIRTLLPAILPQVKLYTWQESDGVIKGFAGVSKQKIEMLFIHPGKIRQGLGRQLIMFCVHSLKIDKVDVNEQNEQAVHFYKKMGFKMTGRHELDSMGKPYPILEMQHNLAKN